MPLIILIIGGLHGWVFSLPQTFEFAAGFAQLGLFGLFWWLISPQPPKRLAWLALLFGIGNFVVGLAWLYISMNRIGGMPAILAALAVVLLATYLSAFGAIALGLARALITKLGNQKLSDHPGPKSLATTQPEQSANPTSKSGVSPLGIALIVAACWGFGEIARGFVLTGFPWLGLGYAHIDSWLSGLAPITGAYGVTMIAVLLAVWVAQIARSNGHHRAHRLRRGLPILATVLAIGATTLIAWALPHGAKVSVRLTQGNVPQSLKFDRDRSQKAVTDYLAMIADSPATLTVLPETAFTTPLRSLPASIRASLAAALQRSGTIAAIGMPLLSSDAQSRANPRVRLTNSVQTISPDARLEHRYDKRHLAPFGEYIPLGFAWFVDLMSIPLGEFGRGAIDQPMLKIKQSNIAFNICYEDLFGEELASQVRQGANVLINLSNMGWFGDSHALPQHLAISRMRSLELARPMLRSTNTGVTAGIDHHGQVFARLPNYRQASLDLLVQPTIGMTPFAQLGMFAPMLLGALLMIFGVLASRVDRMRG